MWRIGWAVFESRMPFPFTIRSEIKIPVADSGGLERVYRRVTAALVKEKAKGLVATGTELAFRGGISCLACGDNQLVAITTGRLDFAYDAAEGFVTIRYRLTLIQMIVLVSVLMIPVFYFQDLSLWELVRAWLWVFGVNYVMAWFRFPRFLRVSAFAEG